MSGAFANIGFETFAALAIERAAGPASRITAPSLTFSYDSQTGNGLIGMGWQLEGLPSVERCPRTIATDGVHGGINFDANNRFCLDGHRLMVISGNYGADGAEYRTEVETFTKIVSRGTAGTGPAWFEARTKSGQVMELGNSIDSRILVQGMPTARTWAVNKVADTKGNYFTVSYTNSDGQAYGLDLSGVFYAWASGGYRATVQSMTLLASLG